MKFKTITTLLLLAINSTFLWSQKELFLSQYMHNRYAINSAFGGSAEALSIYGAYRKQWAEVNGAPSSQLLSAHTPLKNEQVALGIELFSQKYGATQHSGFTASYTFRFKTNYNSWLALSANAGASSFSSNWSKIPILNPIDAVFNNNETVSEPIFGAGVAWYNQKFFTGISLSNIFYTDIYTNSKGTVDLAKAECLLTAGYLWNISSTIQLQPSALMRLNTPFGNIFDVSGTLIWNEFIWGGLSYRNTNDFSTLLAIQPTQQLRIGYSFDFSMGDVSQYNNGAHEISLLYHWGLKSKTINPKFF
jgi:type IX secretion system PorP/SprF family membrane protein